MKKFGLIGHPISHSLSPKLFKAAYNGKYNYDLIESSEFEDAYSKFLAEYDGINITAPFKENAWKKADKYTDSCKKIGAANILLKKGGQILALNSDYSGIVHTLLEYSLEKGSKTLVVGCGGAGKAATIAALDLGLNVNLYNRTTSRAKVWLKFANIEEEVTLIDETELISNFYNYDLIIYTLPCKLDGLEGILTEGHKSKTIIFEANYKDPIFSGEVLKSFLDSGGRYISGKTWLLNQALIGYEIFTGEKVNFGEMKEIL